MKDTRVRVLGMSPSFLLVVLFASTFLVTLFYSKRSEFHPETTISLFQDPIITFDDGLFPLNQPVDVNIGTNDSPFASQKGRHRILVDPLFPICEGNSKLLEKVTAFCMAISDFTGFASFKEYNDRGLSSSLAEVSEGTSHERFQIVSQRTVLVLEARRFFGAIRERGGEIIRLKLDMQGYELTTLLNIKHLLRQNFIRHIKAECFCPIEDKQIYQVNNDCRDVAALLQGTGYTTKFDCSPPLDSTDVYAYKSPAVDFCGEWGD